MKTRVEVLLWAQRVAAQTDARPDQLLEIEPDAGIADAQAAFHRIARAAHPDLHRNSLEPAELETLNTAYARIAGAYQDFRMQRAGKGRPGARPPAKPDPVTSRSTKPTTPPPTGPPPRGPAMSSKALVYYRKAELALRRGDLKGAVLQLKLAIAADPLSTVLRSALAEVESEVVKKT